MKAPPLWRLLLIALVTGVLTVAAFRLALHQRVQEEMLMPAHAATPAETIRALPGFKVKLIHAARVAEGSWIAMTRDPRGRLLIAAEEGKLLRVTLTRGKVAKIERLDQPILSAMSLLCVDHWLYLDGHGPHGWGIYREKDDGITLAAPDLLCPLSNSMLEHGSHAIVQGPDDKLYVVCGNFTTPPPGLAHDSPFSHEAEDQLLPVDLDPHGFEANLKPPGGFILRMDLDGQHAQLFAGGLRNIYSVAFNADGEMFGVDNDAEMDIGTSWYRPVHISHCVAGGEYGFRNGTGKLPYYDQDILPATLDIGLGGPSGMKFPPVNCHLPPSLRDACLVEDWAYGRLLAIHFIPHGATYEATWETVLRGAPLNMTALEFSLDGDLYFITGGRGTSSGLYRLSYDGPKLEEPPERKARQANDEAARAARVLRRQLESFHGQRDPRAPDVVWPSLSSADRWIRYAARVALEFQDVAWWQDRALAETNTDGGLTALLALARCGGRETQEGLLRALDKFPCERLTQEQALLKLRVMELSFIRQGRPSEALGRHAMETLDALYPAADQNVNQELCQLLLYLQAPDAVAKTLALLDQAPTQEEQTYYVMRLRDITNGWTLDLRKDYLGWFEKKRGQVRHRPEIMRYFREVNLAYSDGDSVEPYLDNFWEEAAATLSRSARAALAQYLPKPRPVPSAPSARKFVKRWRMADLEPDLAKLQKHRSWTRGRTLFDEVGCALCHRFANSGGAVGPDLTALGSRMAASGILESILEPSKVLPDQYQNTVLTLRDGDVLTGRVVNEDEQRLMFMTDLIRRTTVEIRRQDVLSQRVSRISPMPEGLVNSLTEAEIWDLIAYLESDGHHARAALPK